MKDLDPLVTLNCKGCKEESGNVLLPISDVAGHKRFSFNTTLPTSDCYPVESVCFHYGNSKDCTMKLWWIADEYRLWKEEGEESKPIKFDGDSPVNISIYNNGKSVIIQGNNRVENQPACNATFNDGMFFNLTECNGRPKRKCKVTFDFEVPTVATTVQSSTKGAAITSTEMPVSHGAGFYVLVIGGPLGVLLVIGLCIVLCYYVRKKRRNNRSKTEPELPLVNSHEQRSGKKKRESSSFDVEPTQDSSQQNSQKVAVADGYKEIGEEMLIVKQGRVKRNLEDRAQKTSEEKDRKEAVDQEMNQHFDDIRKSRMTQTTNETEFSINKEQLAKPPVRMVHQLQPMQSEKEEKATILKTTKKARAEDRPQNNSSGVVSGKEYSLKSTQESSDK